MDLFYATSNKSKVYNMRRRLEGKDIHIITPDELSVKVEVEEDGRTPAENAMKKARAYYKEVHMATIAGDSGLYIDGIEDKDQPGLYVRRVNGKNLTDDEMIEYYSEFAKKYGDNLRANYLTGLALIVEGKEYTVHIPDDEFIITSKVNNNRAHRGNPLDVLTIELKSGKYYNELTDEESMSLAGTFDKQCLKFLSDILGV